MWLNRRENRFCAVSRLAQLYELPGWDTNKLLPATQCHHTHGRQGRLLLYEPYWCPVSMKGHEWIELHKKIARDHGLLCMLGRYNDQSLVPW